MEQKCYKSMTDEQSNKQLKVDIHKLIEGCIKNMVDNKSH
jgi:hypothetical protein